MKRSREVRLMRRAALRTVTWKASPNGKMSWRRAGALLWAPCGAAQAKSRPYAAHVSVLNTPGAQVIATR
jgi:hypothetical protein